MVSAKLVGGMSNQIWSMCAAIGMALKNDFKYGFLLESYTPLQGFNASKYINTVYKNIPRINPEIPLQAYKETSHGYRPIPDEDNLILDGYFQSPLYWNGFDEKIRDLFSFPRVLQFNYNFTVVHVRRGDYLRFPGVHPVLPREYYYEAMDIVGHDHEFLFVSDDINWVKDNFKGRNICYSPFTSEVDDFSLLKYAKNVIAANSSMSVLAGYFNKEGGLKIAPGKKYSYFGVDGPVENDILDNQWIKL